MGVAEKLLNDKYITSFSTKNVLKWMKKTILVGMNSSRFHCREEIKKAAGKIDS